MWNNPRSLHSHTVTVEGVDQSGERGWLLTPTRVVEKETRERLAPILQHADELSARELRGYALI
jgi:hypothetical protein